MVMYSESRFMEPIVQGPGWGHGDEVVIIAAVYAMRIHAANKI